MRWSLEKDWTKMGRGLRQEDGEETEGKRRERGGGPDPCQFPRKDHEREVMKAKEDLQGEAVHRADTKSDQRGQGHEGHFQKVMETEGRWQKAEE